MIMIVILHDKSLVSVFVFEEEDLQSNFPLFVIFLCITFE